MKTFILLPPVMSWIFTISGLVMPRNLSMSLFGVVRRMDSTLGPLFTEKGRVFGTKKE
jgi:hypothetical protein